MKHNKEWHTCDRCGAEMSLFERSILNKKICTIHAFLSFKSSARTLDIELCPKCRKEFERFMRNE